VPGLSTVLLQNQNFPPSQHDQLDGLNCERCIFRTPVLTYAGGAFRLVQTTFVGLPQVILTGPALNTLQVLKLFGAFKQPPSNTPPPVFTPPPLQQATAPETLKATVSNPTAVTLISAVGAAK